MSIMGQIVSISYTSFTDDLLTHNSTELIYSPYYNTGVVSLISSIPLSQLLHGRQSPLALCFINSGSKDRTVEKDSGSVCSMQANPVSPLPPGVQLDGVGWTRLDFQLSKSLT